LAALLREREADVIPLHEIKPLLLPTVEEMLIKPVPSIDFDKCHPERCDHGICIAGEACPHKAFSQEEPYDFPMHDTSMCVGCGMCCAACPLKAIRMV
jgi:Fe-S-cluster-containing hydrogenase component 2